MTVSAKEVQELRKMSGAGMMECKSALSDSGGDIAQAFKLLREKGIAKAEKKSGRDANEGLIGVKVQSEKASIIEVNAETDFVSRNEQFQKFVSDCSKIALTSDGNIDNLLKSKYFANLSLVEDNNFSTSFFLPQAKKILSPISALLIFIIS